MMTIPGNVIALYRRSTREPIEARRISRWIPTGDLSDADETAPATRKRVAFRALSIGARRPTSHHCQDVPGGVRHLERDRGTPDGAGEAVNGRSRSGRVRARHPRRRSGRRSEGLLRALSSGRACQPPTPRQVALALARSLKSPFPGQACKPKRCVAAPRLFHSPTPPPSPICSESFRALRFMLRCARERCDQSLGRESMGRPGASRGVNGDGSIPAD